MNDDYKPRFSFEISFEQKCRADKLLIDYGLRKSIFTKVLDDVLDLIDDKGKIAIGILTSGACKPREILPYIGKAEDLIKKLEE